jgi:hypothetical protein
MWLWGGAGLALALLGCIALIWWDGQAHPAGAAAAPGPMRCAGFPAFARAQGFREGETLVDTQETRLPGLTLVEMTPDGAGRSYRHPSWNQAPSYGPAVLDAAGNIYVAPAPQVSVWRMDHQQLTTIYRVDGATGVMAPYVQIPAGAEPQLETNPYGVLGLATDCETNSLYATSVAGSTPAEARGMLFRIDLGSAAVTTQLAEVDGFGLAIFTGARGKRLYYSLARAPEVWSIALDAAGDARGEPRVEFTFAEHAASPDGRARRIRFGEQETMVLTVSDFTFSLAPPLVTERLAYVYDRKRDSWNPTAGVY